MELKGSRTERNLLMAFAGESQARNRYTFFASQARNDGYIQIATIFEETANQEKEHAKRFFKFLQGGAVQIECAFPAGMVGTTAENLLAAAGGEHEEWSALYPGFAAVARQEGFQAIAIVFEQISVAEKQHDRRYRGLWENIQHDRVFKRSGPVKWRCLNCGYVHEGPEALAACPACAHPRAYFELLAENW
ncbi:MAG: rubrerythrin [Thermoguttaceae bacterium]